jgi:hypothetical protein
MKKLAVVACLTVLFALSAGMVVAKERIPIKGSLDFLNEPSSQQILEKAKTDIIAAITQQVPGVEVVVEATTGITLGGLHDINTMHDRYDIGRCIMANDSYTAAVNAVKGMNCTSGVAQLSCPGACQYVPFLIARNVSVASEMPDVAIAMERVCPACNIGNLRTEDGQYIRARPGIMHGKNCTWIDGDNETEVINIVRFIVLN